MPCAEMKELQATRDRYAERRKIVVAPKVERRRGFDVRRRATQARNAYLMLVHQNNCAVCRSDG
jgi:predicted phage-related endonuclease